MIIFVNNKIDKRGLVFFVFFFVFFLFFVVFFLQISLLSKLGHFCHFIYLIYYQNLGLDLNEPDLSMYRKYTMRLEEKRVIGVVLQRPPRAPVWGI